MEYIDGEDLASLLRRIGRLPPDKALEIARKLCAGLAAAHEKGVLHRDLKPANIMIDGRGQVLHHRFRPRRPPARSTATTSAAARPPTWRPSNSPATKSPSRSDIYALGLVMYEMFTGRAPFEAASRKELLHKQADGPPPMDAPDATLERIIARCLEFDARRRPPTAMAVANALAGGDPLQMAIAAGHTPSPEMVAAAGETETMNPRLAIACLTVTLVAMAAATAIAGKGWAFSRIASETSPEAMAQKARDVLVQIGYTGKPVSTDWGYDMDGSLLERFAGLPREEAWRRIASARPPAVLFWYRQNSERLLPIYFNNTHVTAGDPPIDTFGRMGVRLDPQGRLVRLGGFRHRAGSPQSPRHPTNFRNSSRRQAWTWRSLRPWRHGWLPTVLSMNGAPGPESRATRRCAWKQPPGGVSRWH